MNYRREYFLNIYALLSKVYIMARRTINRHGQQQHRRYKTHQHRHRQQQHRQSRQRQQMQHRHLVNNTHMNSRKLVNRDRIKTQHKHKKRRIWGGSVTPEPEVDEGSVPEDTPLEKWQREKINIRRQIIRELEGDESEELVKLAYSIAEQGDSAEQIPVDYFEGLLSNLDDKLTKANEDLKTFRRDVSQTFNGKDIWRKKLESYYVKPSSDTELKDIYYAMLEYINSGEFDPDLFNDILANTRGTKEDKRQGLIKLLDKAFFKDRNLSPEAKDNVYEKSLPYRDKKDKVDYLEAKILHLNKAPGDNYKTIVDEEKADLDGGDEDIRKELEERYNLSIRGESPSLDEYIQIRGGALMPFIHKPQQDVTLEDIVRQQKLMKMKNIYALRKILGERREYWDNRKTEAENAMKEKKEAVVGWAVEEEDLRKKLAGEGKTKLLRKIADISPTAAGLKAASTKEERIEIIVAHEKKIINDKIKHDTLLAPRLPICISTMKAIDTTLNKAAVAIAVPSPTGDTADTIDLLVNCLILDNTKFNHAPEGIVADALSNSEILKEPLRKGYTKIEELSPSPTKFESYADFQGIMDEIQSISAPHILGKKIHKVSAGVNKVFVRHEQEQKEGPYVETLDGGMGHIIVIGKDTSTNMWEVIVVTKTDTNDGVLWKMKKQEDEKPVKGWVKTKTSKGTQMFIPSVLGDRDTFDGELVNEVLKARPFSTGEKREILVELKSTNHLKRLLDFPAAMARLNAEQEAVESRLSWQEWKDKIEDDRAAADTAKKNRVLFHERALEEEQGALKVKEADNKRKQEEKEANKAKQSRLASAAKAVGYRVGEYRQGRADVIRLKKEETEMRVKEQLDKERAATLIQGAWRSNRQQLAVRQNDAVKELLNEGYDADDLSAIQEAWRSNRQQLAVRQNNAVKELLNEDYDADIVKDSIDNMVKAGKLNWTKLELINKIQTEKNRRSALCEEVAKEEKKKGGAPLVDVKKTLDGLLARAGDIGESGYDITYDQLLKATKEQKGTFASIRESADLRNLKHDNSYESRAIPPSEALVQARAAADAAIAEANKQAATSDDMHKPSWESVWQSSLVAEAAFEPVGRRNRGLVIPDDTRDEAEAEAEEAAEEEYEEAAEGEEAAPYPARSTQRSTSRPQLEEEEEEEDSRRSELLDEGGGETGNGIGDADPTPVTNEQLTTSSAEYVQNAPGRGSGPPTFSNPHEAAEGEEEVISEKNIDEFYMPNGIVWCAENSILSLS